MNERIGPYLIDSRLGVGGMGVVYAAHDEALDRPVALKVISPQLADDEEFRARFVREARAMASLDSPHVVQVYAHGETDGQLWIATQLVPDGDLGTMLRRSGAPTPAMAVELIAQVASGLADAHAAGLVHRDIKPANVLLRRTGSTYPSSYTAYLADFGIARRAGGDHTGLTQGVVGTPSYMAPELHTGGEAGVASDIYSLGCLLWSTLVGHAPFAGTSDYQVVSAHLEQPVPQLAGETTEIREINRILRTAMAKEPGARHRDAAALRDDLRTVQRLVGEEPTVARAAAAAPPSASRRRPVLMMIGGLVLLVFLGVAVWLIVSPEEKVDRVDRNSVLASSATPETSDPPSDPPSSTPLDAHSRDGRLHGGPTSRRPRQLRHRAPAPSRQSPRSRPTASRSRSSTRWDYRRWSIRASSTLTWSTSTRTLRQAGDEERADLGGSHLRQLWAERFVQIGQPARLRLPKADALRG